MQDIKINVSSQKLRLKLDLQYLNTNFKPIIYVSTFKKIFYMKSFLSFLLLFTLTFSSKAQLVINEFSCSNANTIADGFGLFEDWVELYNNTANPINVTGYYLSDDPADPMKWAIPATTDILAGQRRMVFCSDRGVVTAGGQIHPDFKLTQTHNEWFLISDALGVLVDSVKLNLTQRGHSRGRTTDGANTWSLFTTPTANASNAGSTPYTSYALKPLFSVAPGNYTTTQNVAITTTEPNITLRYTIDGSTPTATSTIYTTPIPVSSTMVIRAKAFSSNANIAPSFTETNTYLINEITTMNVVSVSGAFAGGPNNAPTVCSYEFFDKNKNFKIEFEGIARRHGHDSWAYPQKSFKIYADDKQGYAAEHQQKYFNTSTRDSFDMVLIKAAGSDNYNGGPQRAAHIRDMFAHTLSEKYQLDMDGRRYEPTIVLFNGQYWGVYELRERVDKDYIAYNYGVKEKNVDNLKYWGGLQASPGTTTGWSNLVNFIFNNSMTIPSNYQQVKDSLNLKSFAQYFIFNQYLVNSDWLNWNSQWWRGRGNNPVKWRYALWDEDNILDLGQNYSGWPTTTFNADPCDPINGAQLGNVNVPHTTMLDSLMKNPEFALLYKNQWLEMLTGCFKCENILAHFDSVTNIIQPEMQRHINRWSGTYADWQSNITYARNQIVNRCAVVNGKIDTCYGVNPQYLKLNVSPTNAGTIAMDGVTKSPYVWAKLMDADTIYNLKATPTAGAYWTFDHWEKQEPTNIINPNTTTDLIQYDFKESDSVIAYFKYFNYDSVEVTFDINPVPSGTITLNGFLIPSYPSAYTLDRRFSYNIVANGTQYHKFANWSKNDANTIITPDLITKNASFTYLNKETITAVFDSIPIPPPPPPLPTLTDINKRVNIPNAFTPNKDGHNDVFKIQVGKDIIGMEMTIFNRIGTKVYQTNDIQAGWNGQFKNRDCEIGTYQYMVQIKYRNNTTEMFKGDVTLIR